MPRFHKGETVMDETTREAIARLMPMLKALQKSMEHSVNMGLHSGLGATAAKSYRGLHAKVAELITEDPYITETLAYDVPDDAKDEQKIATAQLLTNQLVAYLESQFMETDERVVQLRKRKHGMREIGIDLQGQLLNVTRSALRKAVIAVDRGEDLSGQDLSGADLRNADMVDMNLSGANLEGANLGGAHLNECNLSGANLNGAILAHADLSDVNLSGANAQGANFEGANLNDSNLSGVNFQGVNLYGANLNDSHFNGAILTCANLLDAHLSVVYLSHS